jgi:uncharacterized protein (DUF433 family)
MAASSECTAMDIDDVELPDCLERLKDGSIRVAGHRVSLFHILDAIYNGHSEHQIQSLFPTITRRKLRAVRDFCIRHPEMVRDYHEEQVRAAERLRLSTRNEGPPREELLRRMQERRSAGQPK